MLSSLHSPGIPTCLLFLSASRDFVKVNKENYALFADTILNNSKEVICRVKRSRGFFLAK
jgi:hypothetical protein